MEIAEVNSSHSQSVQRTELMWSGSNWRRVELGVVHSLDQLLGRGRGVSGKTIGSPLCDWETLSAELGWEGWEESIEPEQAEKGGQVLDEPG